MACVGRARIDDNLCHFVRIVASDDPTDRLLHHPNTSYRIGATKVDNRIWRELHSVTNPLQVAGSSIEGWIMGSSRLSARILVAATLALLAVTPLFAVLNVRPTEAQLGPGGRNFSITNLGGRQVRLSWSSGVAASYVLEQIGQRSGAVGSF